jgi:maltose alpha-D-glucosyltransferase/alpha-amylase
VATGFDGDPLWFKDAIVYEVHVRAFSDSEGDGMGDFRGLTGKLAYLQDLGVTTIWLLPFFPSPWRDDGYDISSYTDVHPAYGTLRDFQHFLREAHRRGLRVITELVLNHTSDQHPWFQRSRRAAPGTKWRDYYVWSDTADKYKDARIIFRDFETSNWTWDPTAKAYYWHRFYSHQPDLNFDSPQVREAVLDVMEFWLDLGVDGFRLDAIPYLFEREQTNCENLPETHAFLKQVRRRIDARYHDRVLLAEANQWPEDAIAYFGEGDECHMAFHFPLMPRLFMAIRMEERYPILEILNQTPAIPQSCQWATFLRNHDELTLEMVTDEERDYMYRVYAGDRQTRINLGIRRRLAPLLGNDRRRIELMNALLFSLPGTPVLYYGDEIGMGDNIYLGDRNGVRTPMQWSADRNAGFSRANPQRLYLPVTIDPEYHYEAINVEAQQNNPSSLLWWTRNLIAQRKQHRAFGRGSLEFLHPSNRKVLVFLRSFQEENILVVANLSRFPQHVELDLTRFQGLRPVEIFGRAEFPAIGAGPYVVTLGAYGLYWFTIEPRPAIGESVDPQPEAERTPVLTIDSLEALYSRRNLERLARLLPSFLKRRRWFLGRNRTFYGAEIIEVIPIEANSTVLIGRVEYSDGDPELYLLAASIASSEEAPKVQEQLGDTVFVRLQIPEREESMMYSAIWNREFRDALLSAMARRRRFKGIAGELVGSHTRAFRRVWGPNHPRLDSTLLPPLHANNSIQFGDRFVMKVFRRIEPGVHPEIEIGEMLTRRESPLAPPLAGWVEYRAPQAEPMCVAMLQGFVPNQGDAWRYTTDSLARYFDEALTHPESEKTPPPADVSPLALANRSAPQHIVELVGAYAQSVELLGRRTAELHQALVDPENQAFAPEPFTDHYRLGTYHRMIGLVSRVFESLRIRIPDLPAGVRIGAEQVLSREEDVRVRIRLLRDRRVTAIRIRTHGCLSLTEILHTGKDFVFMDFEGDPSRPLSERRIKRSPLRDIARMLCSFRQAVYSVLLGLAPEVPSRPENVAALDWWAGAWSIWVPALYCKGYLDAARNTPLLPNSPDELRLLLDAYLLEELITDLSRELRESPERAAIPLRGILAML